MTESIIKSNIEDTFKAESFSRRISKILLRMLVALLLIAFAVPADADAAKKRSSKAKTTATAKKKTSSSSKKKTTSSTPRKTSSRKKRTTRRRSSSGSSSRGANWALTAADVNADYISPEVKA